MYYQPRLRNFQNTYGFDCNSECVWVVYPPGCAGDLLGAIVGLHYPRTGTDFLGIDNTGRVILNTIDNKWCNFELAKSDTGLIDLERTFIDTVNQEYRAQCISSSLSGQTLLVNHLWHDNQVQHILDTFSNAHVIRITPANLEEIKIVTWLHKWKNHGDIADLQSCVEIQLCDHNDTSSYSHNRLLDVTFGSMWSSATFDQTYDQIIQHLALPYKLVRYDLVQFWLSCQHKTIQPDLKNLFQQPR